MPALTLHEPETESYLCVPVWFLTDYMPEANGDFVKVYLFLLMEAEKAEGGLTISSVADVLSCTESDVTRALRYWSQKGLLLVRFDDDGVPLEISFADPKKEQEPAKEALSEAEKESEDLSFSAPETAFSEQKAEEAESEANPDSVLPFSAEDPDFQTLLLVSEKYLARTLSSKEVEMFAAWYRDTGKNFDLIDYLVQYCVEKGVPSLSYMNKVLLNWQNAGITSVREAKEYSRTQFEDARPFLKTFGITGRTLTTEESEKLEYWKNNLGFSMDMILEAARQTMARTHGPNLDYLEKILLSWDEKGIRTPEDVKKEAEAFESEKAVRNKTRRSSSGSNTKNRFHNFDQRSYDYDGWENDLLNPYRKQPETPEEEDLNKLLAPYRKNNS